MVRAVASWGVEIGWRGQREWRHEMTLLQNAAMRETLGAVKGSSGRKANAIAAVEDLETFARAAAGRFLARTLCDPPRAGVGVVDEVIAGKGRLLLGVTAGADMWMWWTWDLASPPPPRCGNERSRKLVKGE